MRGMAGIAISLLDWIMRKGTLDHSPLCGKIFLLLFFSELFLRCHGVNMALSAQGFHVSH